MITEKIQARSNEQAEKAVLGSLLVRDCLYEIRDLLEPRHFYSIKMGEIYGAILALSDDKKSIDAITVAERMRDKLEDAHGFLANLIDAAQFISHVQDYAKIVVGLHYEREIINASRALALDQSGDSLEKVRQLVLAKESLGAPVVFDYKTDLVGMMESVQANKIKSLSTGIRSIDDSFKGMQPGEINTWGAATSVGKSLTLLNLMDMAAKNGDKCLYVGTEMSAMETVKRHLSIITAIQPWKIRRAILDMEESSRMVDAISERMVDLPIRILDEPEPAIKDIEAAISATGASVVFLDYLERFTFPKEENMRLRVKEFMRRLKNMARRRGVVIHLAAQLNRDTYGSEEKRPTLANLSESSAVEKESDRVVLLWSPKAKQTEGNTRVLEAVIAKNRHGKRGLIFDLLLDENSLRITDRRDDVQDRTDAG